MSEHDGQSSYWHKQTLGKPLFPELLWSRPENKAYAGKLLIVGGNAYGFAAPAEAFAVAEKAGIGVARVLLPDSLQKTVGKTFAAGEFAPTRGPQQNAFCWGGSTPSGSFSQKALSEFLTDAAWADGVLLAGDLGRNSETAILLEKFASKYTGQLTITKDAADYFISSPQAIMNRSDTTLVISFSQLQKFGTAAHFTTAFTFNMDLLRLVDALHDFTMQYACSIIVKHLDTIFVAVNGQVSTTKPQENQPIWRIKTASQAATWWLQNPSKPFAAFCAALV